MSISENISLLIRLQKGEQNGTNFFKLLSISLFPLRSMVFEVQNSHSCLKIYTHLIAIMLWNYVRKIVFCEMYGWLTYSYNMSFCGDLTMLLYTCVGNQTTSTCWTTHNDLFCITLLKTSQAAAISTLFTTLDIPMSVRVYLNTYNTVVTSRNLRLAFRQLYFMRKKCIHMLCICLITKGDYFPIQP